MLRILSLFVLVTALTLAACGRQVTFPNPSSSPGGVPAGFMQIKYRTANTMDFQNVRYFVVFNTSGNGIEPYPNGFQSGYANYSFAFMVGGSGGTVSQPVLWQYIRNVATGQITAVAVPYTTQQVQLVPNSDGNNREFTLLFARNVFSNAFGPSSAPMPTATPVNIWAINFITTAADYTPLDALGPNGLQANNYLLRLDVSTAFDEVQRLTVPAGAPQAATPNAQLFGGEIINNP